jgi:hypothetical protein
MATIGGLGTRIRTLTAGPEVELLTITPGWDAALGGMVSRVVIGGGGAAASFAAGASAGGGATMAAAAAMPATPNANTVSPLFIRLPLRRTFKQGV